MSDQLFFLMKVSFFQFFFSKKKKRKNGRKERRKEEQASWNHMLHPLQKSSVVKSSVVTFLWSQSNDWPDSPYVETCSYSVRYWNLEPLKWRNSWTWVWIKWYSWKLSEVHAGLHSSRHLWSNQPFRRCLLGGSWVTITAPILGTYEYATPRSRGDFADVSKDTDLEMKRLFWII